ncbi:hypothetical protein [Pseudomonas anguilliseptica]|uniref:Uncharacterized protein n=1 Tax=Pseudomonas anguilliseptica TaxID=53406 RepID=A0A1H4XUX8_PSEAG|nr:hypothetical protein [Pseudomonas anguilliseptica]SED09325.1 hypothetical protein SAMN05421553_2016 [Pseudomonas anguilliseptica]
MQRYHDPRIDPLPQRSAHLENEAARIEQATQAFLANGGKIEQIGYQMSDAPAVFVINAEKTPVYAHLFQAPAPTVVADEPQAEPVPDTASDLETKQAAQIMARAALGEPPKWIAKQLHMTEKRVRQLARDYHINFRAQR